MPRNIAWAQKIQCYFWFRRQKMPTQLVSVPSTTNVIRMRTHHSNQSDEQTSSFSCIADFQERLAFETTYWVSTVLFTDYDTINRRLRCVDAHTGRWEHLSASVATVTMGRWWSAGGCGGWRGVVGLRAGWAQTVDGCLGSGARGARRHRQAQHVHQSLSHRVAVIRRVRSTGRVALLSLVHPANTSNQSYVIHSAFSSDAAGRALDLWSTGHGFKSYSGQQLHNNLGQVVHTYVPLTPTWYRPKGGNALWLAR